MSIQTSFWNIPADVQSENVSLMPVPARQRLVDADKTATAFHQLVAATQGVAGLAGYDADGDFAGVRYFVALRRLWINPASPLVYSPNDIDEMAASLQAKGQQEPLIVAQFQDPRPEERGGTGGDLVVIDGARRVLSAAHLPFPMERMEVIIRPLPTFYHVMLETATAKLSARPLTEIEAGKFVRRLLAVHGALLAQGVQVPELNQQEIGRMLGRSQSTVSKWLALGQLADDVQVLLDNASITGTQALELLHLAPRDQSVVAARVAEANTQHNGPIAQREVRAHVVRRKQERGEAPDLRSFFPASHESSIVLPALRLAELAHQSPASAVGDAVHDLTVLLDATVTQWTAEHRRVDPAIVALVRALKHPAIEALVNASQQSEASGNDGNPPPGTVHAVEIVEQN